MGLLRRNFASSPGPHLLTRYTTLQIAVVEEIIHWHHVLFPIALSFLRHFCIVTLHMFFLLTVCILSLFDFVIDNPFRLLLSNVLTLIVPIALPQESKRVPGGGMCYLVCCLVPVDQLAKVTRLTVAELLQEI